MSADPSWKEVWEIFEEAIGLSADEREGFLARACEGEPAKRKAVEDLLAADATSHSLLDEPMMPRADRGGGGFTEAQGALPRITGRHMGPYRLLRQIGQGGMSTVYLAVRDDEAYNRRVVVKVVRQGMESQAMLRRLRTERQILASLDHSYIARLYDGGATEEGLPYVVMEYVEGEPIDAYCDERELSVRERLQLFRKVCGAVHYAHQNLVVHRDLKPSNILVTADGQPKLLDFGIAKLLNPDLMGLEQEPTATWQRVMTPSYASPEQVRGRPITTATDVYQLGVLLYKLLTGQLPFKLSGRSPQEIERILTEEEPSRPSDAVGRTRETSEGPASQVAAQALRRERSLRRRLAGDLDAIVLKALRSSPQRRYGSVEQLSGDLERFLAGRPITARQGTVSYRVSKFVRRHRTAVTAGSVAGLLLLAFVGAMIWQSARVAFERDQARGERDKKGQVLQLMLEVFGSGDPYHPGSAELTVREALAESVPVLERRLSEQPDVRGELLQASGTILARLGHYDVARAQLEQALELHRGVHGEDHRSVAETLAALASVYKIQGDLDRAEALARQGVALAQGLEQTTGETLVEPLNELVSVLCYRDAYEAAEGPARQALAVARQLPRDTDGLIMALEQLAIVENGKGAYEEAVLLYRQALAQRRMAYGENHPSQIGTLNNLGLALRRLGELAAAERALEETLALERAVYGDDYPELAITLNNVGGLRFALGQYEAAQEAYQEALGLIVPAVGPDHWRVFFLKIHIEATRLRGGDAAGASERLRTLLSRWRSKLGPDHWVLAMGESVLGEALATEGRLEEAEPLLEGSYLQLLERRAKHRYLEDALERLSGALEQLGRSGEIPRFQAMLPSGEG